MPQQVAWHPPRGVDVLLSVAMGTDRGTGIGYTGDMTTKPILNFTIDPALLKRLEDYWHKHKFANRAETVKFLIDAAMKANLTPKEK
jgi:hypothetical protein